jgi:hypothetical protein
LSIQGKYWEIFVILSTSKNPRRHRHLAGAAMNWLEAFSATLPVFHLSFRSFTSFRMTAQPRK